MPPAEESRLLNQNQAARIHLNGIPTIDTYCGVTLDLPTGQSWLFFTENKHSGIPNSVRNLLTAYEDLHHAVYKLEDINRSLADDEEKFVMIFGDELIQKVWSDFAMGVLPNPQPRLKTILN